MDTSERWVTVAAAARALGKSDRTIRRWVADGKLPADRTGAVLLVDIAKHVPDTEPAVPSDANETPSAPSGADALLVEIEDLRAELGRCQAAREFLKSERDYLRQVHALAVSGEQRLLTERAGERPRRFRWPWQRREG